MLCVLILSPSERGCEVVLKNKFHHSSFSFLSTSASFQVVFHIDFLVHDVFTEPMLTFILEM